MDDLIYFLLVVGWLAFSLFANQKKKAKKNTPPASQPAGQSFPETLEEILLGPVIKAETAKSPHFPETAYPYGPVSEEYSSLETIDDSEATSSLETIEPEVRNDTLENLSLEEQYATLNTLKRVSLADERVSTFKQTVFHDEEPAEIEEETSSRPHSWRQAVIYSTLLERKYC